MRRLSRRDAMRGGAAAVLAALGSAAPASAQAIPDTVRILAGFSPGGGIDVVARKVAEKLNGTPYARTVVVENRTGAGGRLAIEATKGAAPDGKTLLLTPGSMLYIYPYIYNTLSYDPVADLAAVSLAATVAMGIGVGPMVPGSVRTVPDFLAWAKTNPDKANFGTGGAGSMPHFVGAMLEKASGVKLSHVPFRGTAAAMTDLIGGQIAAVTGPEADLIPHLKGGRVRLLATSGKERSRFSPDVPTFAEQGFADMVMEEWFAFFMPAKTPPEAVRRAADALAGVLRQDSVIGDLAEMGFNAAPSSPAELAARLRAGLDFWGPVVRATGFTAAD